MADLKQQQSQLERLAEQTYCIRDACLAAAHCKLLGKSLDASRDRADWGSAVVFGGFVRGGSARFGCERNAVDGVEIVGSEER
jgi:hypothetical protein